MAKRGHTVEEISRVLREAESVRGWSRTAASLGSASRVLLVEEGVFRAWSERVRQLREENGKLKRAVSDLSLDRHTLRGIVARNAWWETLPVSHFPFAPLRLGFL